MVLELGGLIDIKKIMVQCLALTFLLVEMKDLLTLQYGIIVGLLFLFCMTLLPLVYYLYYLKNKINNKLVFLFIINFSMVFSGLTNAALMKHQIFAFLAFNLIVLYSIVKTNRIEDSKKLNFNENSNNRNWRYT